MARFSPDSLPAVPSHSVPEPSAQRRQLGRSRLYVRDDVPERLFQWHAPRANRWEQLRVEAGPLAIEWLEVEGVRQEELDAGDMRWIAPGARWRIHQMGTQARFHFEIHADEAIEPSTPQPRRAELLDAAARIKVADVAELEVALTQLQAGSRCLIRAGFDFTLWFQAFLSEQGGRVCWHPLQAGPEEWVALVVRSDQAVDLLEYLGRDHAVIEATLTGAQQGDGERLRWLANTLARHLVIEENLLFPHYLEAGGKTGWVNGLRKEHRMLEQQLQELADPDVQRRFLLLLEAHDEKEEQIVYPDIAQHLDGQIDPVLAQVMALGLE